MEEKPEENNKIEENKTETKKEKKVNKTEEKTVVSIKLTTLLFIIILIAAIVTGVIIFMNNGSKDDNKTKNETQTNTATDVNQTQSNTTNTTNTVSEKNNTNNYKIEGTYYKDGAEGDEPAYKFLANNKVEYGALWTCYGTYTINGDTIKIMFDSAIDPDGKKVNDITSLGVKEKVELSIVNSNKLKDNKDSYIKNKAPATTQKDEIKKIVLDGTYGMPNSDSSWEFTQDGKASSRGNVTADIGTYATTGKDTIEIHYTQRKTYDDSGNATTTDINRYESATVVNGDVYINGNKMTRYGDVVKEETNSNSTENLSATDKIAKELFEKGSYKIRETQYTDYYQYKDAQPLTEKTINGATYRKRNVLYSDVEKEYAKIFTGEALEKVMGKRFMNIDGYLYVKNGGATGWDVKIIELSKVSESNNEIKYIVKYCDSEEDVLSAEQSCNMTIKLVSGEYKIVSTDYCNL